MLFMQTDTIRKERLKEMKTINCKQNTNLKGIMDLKKNKTNNFFFSS